MSKTFFLKCLPMCLVCFLNQALAASYCVTEPISSLPITQDTAWSKLNCTQAVTIIVARGEIEPASVVIKSDVRLSDITIRASDLTSKDDAINLEHIDIRIVKQWYQAGSAWQGIRQNKEKRVLVPELLLKDENLITVDRTLQKNYLRATIEDKPRLIDISNDTSVLGRQQVSATEFYISDSKNLESIDLLNGENKQIWLTFEIPEDTKHGTYHGELKAEGAEGLELFVVPITVDVAPYVLDPPRIEYSMYYRGYLTSHGGSTISSEGKSDSQMHKELQNMLRHGVVNPTIYQPYDDMELIKSVIDLRKKSGIVDRDIYYLGVTTGNYKDNTDVNRRISALTELERQLKTSGQEKANLFIYAIDEAEERDLIGQHAIWQEMKNNGWKIFAAAWQRDREKFLAGKIDVFVNGLTPDPAINERYAAEGTKVYLYNRPQVGVEDPHVYRLNYGLRAWQADFSGVMNYAYQDSFGFIWNDFDHDRFRDHVFAYPTSDGVVDTIAWEGFREAVDDVRYLSTLINLVENEKKRLACEVGSECFDTDNYIRHLKKNKLNNLSSIRHEIDRRIRLLCCEQSSQ